MQLSTNLDRVYPTFGMKEAFEIWAQVGFQSIDFNDDLVGLYKQEHDEAFFAGLKNDALQAGITIGQMHTPYPSSFPDEEETAQRFQDIVRSIKNAASLGVPIVVVHACRHLEKEDDAGRSKSFAFNLDFFKRLAPYAREYGVKIAIENIGSVKHPSAVSTPERINRLYDTLNDPVFTLCFDVGHCLLEGFEPADAIRQLGHRLVDGCTHVHDNFGDTDAHTLPYYGITNWEETMKALAEIGYKGNLSYEASEFIKDIPRELYVDGLRYMAKVGQYLIGRFEYYKKNK